MNNFGIAKPCSESWDLMTKNTTGAFCQSCSKNVIDFTSMTNTEINRTLLDSRGAEICGRIRPEQVRKMNNEFELWQMWDKKSFQRAFLLSLIVVFGFSLFSCSDNVQKQEIQQVRQVVKEIVSRQDIVPEPEKPKEQKTAHEEYVISCVIPSPLISVSFPEEPEPAQKETVRMEHFYQGGMGFSMQYLTYAEETVAPADEYDEAGNLIPKEFSALAFPNPTRDLTTLEIRLPSADDFTILLMDMSGKTLAALHSGNIDRGTFRAEADLSEYPAGTYFIAVASKSYKEVVKVIRL